VIEGRVAEERPERRGPRFKGRRLAQAIYYALAVCVAMAATWQITQQVFFADRPSGKVPYANCDEGLRALYQSIETSRVAATLPAAGERQDSEAALRRYRQTVEQTWRWRQAVARMCGPERNGVLDAIERLRYSEEHGVRQQAAELSALRRTVRVLVSKELGSATPLLPNGAETESTHGQH
jgi:hypothetical protein